MSYVPFVAIDATDANRPLYSADATASAPPTSNLAVKTATASPSQRRRLPSWIGFPAAVVISLGLSGALYSVVPSLIGYELAPVSRELKEPYEIGGLVAWRVAAIAIAWSSGLDYLDLSSLSLLTNAPYYALLHVFYQISFQALGLVFSIDTLCLALPFFLLRPLNFYNARKRTVRPQTVSEIASDRAINLYLSVFAAAMYSLIVYSSLYTWLPVYMIHHFDEVKSLDAAHNASLMVLLVACVPLGYAAKNFLFKPSIAVARTMLSPFDPITATLGEISGITLVWACIPTGPPF